jgi:hypothetical protein
MKTKTFIYFYAFMGLMVDYKIAKKGILQNELIEHARFLFENNPKLQVGNVKYYLYAKYKNTLTKPHLVSIKNESVRVIKLRNTVNNLHGRINKSMMIKVTEQNVINRSRQIVANDVDNKKLKKHFLYKYLWQCSYEIQAFDEMPVRTKGDKGDSPTVTQQEPIFQTQEKAYIGDKGLKNNKIVLYRKRLMSPEMFHKTTDKYNKLKLEQIGKDYFQDKEVIRIHFMSSATLHNGGNYTKKVYGPKQLYIDDTREVEDRLE